MSCKKLLSRHEKQSSAAFLPSLTHQASTTRQPESCSLGRKLRCQQGPVPCRAPGRRGGKVPPSTDQGTGKTGRMWQQLTRSGCGRLFQPSRSAKSFLCDSGTVCDLGTAIISWGPEVFLFTRHPDGRQCTNTANGQASGEKGKTYPPKCLLWDSRAERGKSDALA